MGGQVALHPEVAGGFNDAPAKELLPQNIDKHPRSQWIILVEQPLGQSQTDFGVVFV